jgi:hypothetical protein
MKELSVLQLEKSFIRLANANVESALKMSPPMVVEDLEITIGEELPLISLLRKRFLGQTLREWFK